VLIQRMKASVEMALIALCGEHVACSWHTLANGPMSGQVAIGLRAPI